MRYKTDMNGVDEGGSFELLPEGTYICNIDEEIGEKITKNGDPMALITLIVATGEHAGRKVWDNIIFPEPDSPAIKIKGRTKHFLHCLGLEYDGELSGDTDFWAGKAITVRVVHKKGDDGVVRAKIAEHILDEGNQEVADAERVPF